MNRALECSLLAVVPIVAIVAIGWLVVSVFGWWPLLIAWPLIVFPVLALWAPFLERFMERRRLPKVGKVIEEAERQGDYKLAQELRLKMVWSLVKEPTGFFRINQIWHDLPERLDPMNDAHLRLVESIKSSYSTVAGYPEGEFAEVAFRPESILPLPKEAIRAALVCLKECVEGKGKGRLVPSGSEWLSDAEYVNAIEGSLINLDNFIDVPRELIPLDRLENGIFGLTILDGAGVEEALRRVAHDRQVRDYIRQSSSDRIEGPTTPDN